MTNNAEINPQLIAEEEISARLNAKKDFDRQIEKSAYPWTKRLDSR